jgi:hypothetical protein
MLLALPLRTFAQEAPSATAPPAPAPVEREEPQQPEAPAQPAEPLPPPAPYDPAIFERRIPSADLTDLLTHAGEPSGKLWRDGQFRKLVNHNTPDVMYHFGRDMPFSNAVDTAMSGSPVPIVVRDNRYVLLSGRTREFGFSGRAFLWFDTQEGIFLGGFYFNPSNGEPTPTLTVFSRQTRQDNLSLGQLPPAFGPDLYAWLAQSGVPTVESRYFIDDLKKRTLLQHDEDFCLYPDGTRAPVGDPCEQRNVDAADIDLTSADYLAAIHYATNGTAWMLDPSANRDFYLSVNNRCGVALNCRVILIRQRTRSILRRR